MEKQKNLKAFILDFDGTIIDLAIDWESLRRRIKKYLANYGIATALTPLYPEIFRAIEILRRKGLDVKLIQNKIYSIIEEEENKALSGSKPIKGAKEFLVFLRQNGFKVAVLTTNSGKLAKKFFLHNNLPAPDIIVGREDVRKLKPDPEGLKKIISTLKLDRKKCVLVGDRDGDTRVGRALDINTILVMKEGRIYRSRPDFSVKTLHEVIRIAKDLK